MSRYVSLARKVFRTNPVISRASGPMQVAKFTFPVGLRNFSADAHAGHGADEPFLDPKMVTDRIIEVIKNFEKVNSSKITVGARFKEDLDLDSLDAVEVVMAIEEEFNIEIPDSEADKILSIPDAVAFISAHPMAK